MRSPGVPFHIKGEGNGYLLEVANLRIYIAGDTELIPEMEKLGPVDIAFLPKNLPYTMSDQMFVETARLIRPTYLYPYHYFEVDRETLQKALRPFGSVKTFRKPQRHGADRSERPPYFPVFADGNRSYVKTGADRRSIAYPTGRINPENSYLCDGKAESSTPLLEKRNRTACLPSSLPSSFRWLYPHFFRVWRSRSCRRTN